MYIIWTLYLLNFFKVGFNPLESPGFYYAIVFILCVVAVIYAVGHTWNRHKNSSEDEIETKSLDDFYPFPRKVKISTKPQAEDGFHKKLNYQFLIERMTRKLYLCFFTIIGFSTTLIYVIYRTSLTEKVTPTEEVMDNYKVTLNKIIDVENLLEEKQIGPIERMGFDDKEEKRLKSIVVQKAIQYEDELVSNVSKKFFLIYYARYVTVRLFIALVMFFIVKYIINIYFKIRADRNDLIRKEEALSSLFYVVDAIEGNIIDENGDKEEARYKILENKIPDFPLLKLFEYSSEKDKKSESEAGLVELIGTLNSTISTQQELILSLKELIINKKKGGSATGVV